MGRRKAVECAKVFNLCLHDPILRNQTANFGRGGRELGGHHHPGVAAHRPHGPITPLLKGRKEEERY